MSVIGKLAATCGFCIMVATMHCSDASGDIVNVLLSGDVSAEFDGNQQSDTSIIQADSLSQTATANNSLTRTDLNWDWDGSTLTGASDSIAEKTVSARPGGQHIADSTLTFTFEIDSAAIWNLDGTWGTNNLSGSDDSLSYTLIGPSGIVSTAISGGTTGIASEAFGDGGSLVPGTYTFSITSLFTETINNQQTGVDARTSGWTLSQFSITTVAVPEPSGAWIVLAAASVATTKRRRKEDVC